MGERGSQGLHWGAVALGWLVAVIAGIILTPVLRFLYELVIELSVERGELTTAAAAISVLSGFLAYLIGGYVAGKLSGGSGGLNGAMTAVFGGIVGLILAVLLSVFGLVFAEGVALPPSAFGVAGVALILGFVFFLINLFGGYVGGKLGEPAGSAGGRTSNAGRTQRAR